MDERALKYFEVVAKTKSIRAASVEKCRNLKLSLTSV
jgi:DNA-binding transcriptional LysR family regulator